MEHTTTKLSHVLSFALQFRLPLNEDFGLLYLLYFSSGQTPQLIHLLPMGKDLMFAVYYFKRQPASERRE